MTYRRRCPRSDRYRYLDGWREKETRVVLTFGRGFEKALAAYFCGEDCGAILFKERRIRAVFAMPQGLERRIVCLALALGS